MHFLNGLQPQFDLTYDDVFMVPNESDVTSRLDVDLSSDDGTGTTIPLVVANMTAIAGRRMAETTARRGALTIIPQDIPVDVVRNVIAWTKQRHLVFDTAITLAPHTPVGEAQVLLDKRAHGAAVVTEGNRPIGLITEKDLSGVDRFVQVRDVMSRELVTVQDDVDVVAAFDTLSESRRRLAPVGAADGTLVGVLPRQGARRAHHYTPAVDAGGARRDAPGQVRGVSGGCADFGVDSGGGAVWAAVPGGPDHGLGRRRRLFGA